MDNLTHMVTFAHVVRAGSFAAAAKRLGVASSVVSKHVSKLERDLGANLLQRSTRKLSLTEAGTAYYAHCARILEEVEQSKQAVAELQAEPRGKLRLSAMPSFAHWVLAELLPEFLARYPKLELEIVCNERLVDLAEEGFDLALRITGQPNPNLVARRLAPIRFVACATPGYLSQHGAPRTPEDLPQHRCIGYSQSLTGSVWRLSRDGREFDATAHSVVQINSIDAARRLVLSGVGIAPLPTYAIGADLRSGQLVRVLPEYQLFSDSVLYTVYLPNRFGSPKLRAFVEFLAERIGEPPYWERDIETVAPARKTQREQRKERVLSRRAKRGAAAARVDR